jgi:hypothetical protein
VFEIVSRNESFNSEVRRKFGIENPDLINQFRIECHEGDQTDIFIWGEDFPGFQGDDYGLQKGVLFEVNGETILNTLEEVNPD